MQRTTNMASKFDEEKRVLINDLTEEKAAHMHTLDLLAEERRKSALIPKLEHDLASLRISFEDMQKMLIQSQKKNVEDRNKAVIATQQIQELQTQIEQLQLANDKTQSLLEESMQELDDKRALIEANPSLNDLQALSVELTQLRERTQHLEIGLAATTEENTKIKALLATAAEERDRAVEELKTNKTSTSTLQAQLDEAMFNLEMSTETIKDLHAQLTACGVSSSESPSLSGSTASLVCPFQRNHPHLHTASPILLYAPSVHSDFNLQLEQENAKLSEEINVLKANLVATEVSRCAFHYFLGKGRGWGVGGHS
jgi:chromosome segregation ATPase